MAEALAHALQALRLLQHDARVACAGARVGGIWRRDKGRGIRLWVGEGCGGRGRREVWLVVALRRKVVFTADHGRGTAVNQCRVLVGVRRRIGVDAVAMAVSISQAQRAVETVVVWLGFVAIDTSAGLLRDAPSGGLHSSNDTLFATVWMCLHPNLVFAGRVLENLLDFLQVVDFSAHPVQALHARSSKSTARDGYGWATRWFSARRTTTSIPDALLFDRSGHLGYRVWDDVERVLTCQL